MAWLFHVPSPNALNTLLAMTGATQPVFRLPYVPVNKAAREQGLALLSGLNKSDWVGNELNLMDDRDFTLV
jgi:4-hydroxy-tetrahydrodipicolinate synthase